jgi:hypothetical protein
MMMMTNSDFIYVPRKKTPQLNEIGAFRYENGSFPIKKHPSNREFRAQTAEKTQENTGKIGHGRCVIAAIGKRNRREKRQKGKDCEEFHRR